MPVAQDLITKYLRKWEGTSLVGYVPCQPRNYYGDTNPDGYEPIGQSGVTIATGLDLGQHDREDLVKIGLSEPLLSRFEYVVGKKKKDALKAIYGAVLRVSEEERDVIDAAVIPHYARRAAYLYQKDSPLRFSTIPDQAQVVVTSLVFQFGNPRTRKAVVWKALACGDWKEAAGKLRNDTSAYKARRREEGALLGEIAS